jgi:hypothetical protein
MRDVYKKYDFSTGSASSHHKNRQMFIVLNSEVLIAKKGVTETHYEWLLAMGSSEGEADKIIKESLRGILTKERKLYFYKDFDFSGDESMASEIRRVLPQLKKGLDLTGSEDIYAGLIRGELGEDWEPKVKLGTVDEILGIR